MALIDTYDHLTARLRASGDFVWPTVLRLILFWEFWESGITKFRGNNWFADIPWADWQKGFPWPFSQLSTDINWFFASWGELFFAFLIGFGLLTRFTAISLIVITAVATAAVHWPNSWDSLPELWAGYLITAKGGGNFKIPLLYIVMLLPLVFYGGGKLSLDHLLLKLTGRDERVIDRNCDWLAMGLALLVLGLSVIWVEPMWGWVLVVMAVLVAAIPRLRGTGT